MIDAKAIRRVFFDLDRHATIFSETRCALRRGPFAKNVEPQDLLEIVNLDIHGCATPYGANRLIQLGLVVPRVFEVDDKKSQKLRFEAVEIDVGGHITIGQVKNCLASQHPFIAEARDKIHKDQFLDCQSVVFETGYLEGLQTADLAQLHSRSAEDWQGLP
ncbi:hypothetical protein SAMN05444358_1011790 [Ruegeria halocynthiae]|uniref:Uncharacterized protein n=1 Tax=Ruegeria halocynthiae TaxID=985054 RepID=A0A1H2WIQ1_9RHOB|nr:hypothetical protein [Ruegeria halocynthiae]SDW79899.1 hypothetical protein SAMN05444358_1011790 [Ruegeria halocynthiae]